MHTLNTDQKLQLRRASRRSALLTILGASILAGTLGFSGWKLRALETDVQKLEELAAERQTDLRHARQQLDDANRELNTSKRRLRALQTIQLEIQEGLNDQFGGFYEDAIRHFDAALQYDRKNLSVYAFKAQALYRLQEYQSAIRICNIAIRLNPGYLPPYYTKALALHKSDDTDTALEIIAYILDVDPNSYYLLKFDQNFSDLNKSSRQYRRLMDKHLKNIRIIQKGLKALRLYSGKIDGLIGPRTRTAIEEFCRLHSMDPDSVKTSELANAVIQAANM